MQFAGRAPAGRLRHVLVSLVVVAAFLVATPGSALAAPGDVTFNFVLSASNPGENDGVHSVDVTFTIEGGGNLTDDATIDVVALGSSSAMNPADYTASTVTVMFTNGTASGSTEMVDLTLVDDDLVEGTEVINLDLQNPVYIPANTVIGGTNTHDVSITDADTASAEFTTATSSVTENGGAQNVSMTLTTAPATATLAANAVFDIAAADVTTEGDPTDYTTGATVTFLAGDGDTDTRNVTVTPVNDALVEGDEDLTLTATVNSGAASLGAQDTNTVTITDGDSAMVTFVSGASAR